MSASAFALLAYVSWTLLLVASIVVTRSWLTVTGARAANSFSPSGDDIGPFSGRLCRAHANCYESFAWVGGVLIVALLTDNAAITDGLAFWMIAARVGQSLVHLTSISAMAVTVRFGFFLIQVGISAWWAYGLATQAFVSVPG